MGTAGAREGWEVRVVGGVQWVEGQMNADGMGGDRGRQEDEQQRWRGERRTTGRQTKMVMGRRKSEQLRSHYSKTT